MSTSAVESTHAPPAARSIREVVFGVNDGLVSIAGVMVSVTISNMSRHEVVVAGFAAMVAATVSMALGQFLSTRAEHEFFQSEWEREMREVREVPDEERREVEEILVNKGFTSEEATNFTKRLMKDETQWVDFMMKEELGIMMEDSSQSWKDAVVMALSVIAGSLPPIIPFLLPIPTSSALMWSIICAISAAFLLGTLKAVVARGSWWRSGIQFLLVTGAAVAVGVVVGKALGGLAGVIGG
jgi:VIT1/CCC1 family predicted Fe2+/Mn2+ transporter